MATSGLKSAPEKKPRRRDVARNNIISAAREIFAERGYARATTRDIANRAKSSEVLLFRYFQSKDNLFRQAVVEPFDGMLKTFLEAQTVSHGPEPFSGSEEFVKDLFKVVSEHRSIFFTLISTRLYEDGAVEEHVNSGGFHEYFRVAVERIKAELDQLGVTPAVSPDISSRISFVSVIATALFHDWIFGGTDIEQDEMVVALNKFIISGMTDHDLPE